MNTMDTINVTGAGDGEHWLVGGDITTIKASSRDTSGDLLVLDVTVPPGGGPPVLHRHGYSEVFLFQEGEFEVITAGGDHALSAVRVAAGDTVAIPSMAWHNFKNIGASRGTFLAVHTPPVMEPLIHEIGVPVDDPLNPRMLDGPPSAEERQRFMSLIGQYMEMLPLTEVGYTVG